LRTEFLYMERPQFPSEEEQYRLYRRVLERMEGLPVTLRTLDIGNDKQLPYFRRPRRTIRRSAGAACAFPWSGRTCCGCSCGAALRASAHGRLRLLLPMVTSLEEIREVHRDLRRSAPPAQRPGLRGPRPSPGRGS
jgi:phosphotransferase system enzyme I (PtsI)